MSQLLPPSNEPIRPRSRRHGPRIYVPERLSRTEQVELRRKPPAAVAQRLREAGAAGSALRRRLKELAIDPKLARLVLVLDGHRTTRVLEIAWRLDVSKTTASRQLDRAERAGLVDKRYLAFDRRGTWIQLTRRGRELRARVLEEVTSLDTERPAGPAHGVRAYRPRFSVSDDQP
jgi:DNA-binding MarR family transcriptional regulator